MKENIENIPDGLAIVNQLQGRTFDWKEVADMPEGRQYGLIAQELEEVVPDLIHDRGGIREVPDNPGTFYKSIKMGGIIPILIEAVKELSAKVTALENA